MLNTGTEQIGILSKEETVPSHNGSRSCTLSFPLGDVILITIRFIHDFFRNDFLHNDSQASLATSQKVVKYLNNV